MSQKKFKNIIFDLGGVVINLDVDKTFDYFADIADMEKEELKAKINETNLFESYEKGLISSRQFRDEMIELINQPMTDGVFDEAWNAMLLDLPKERLELIDELKEHYNLFVLSNTNEIHINEFHSIVDAVFGYTNYQELFQKIYYSFEINRKKPDAEIFNYVLQEQNLIAEETVFFEDTSENLDAAASLWIETRPVSRNKLDLKKLRNEFL